MTLVEAILLGMIQGITEFLPISSSAHLLIFQHLLGLPHTHQTIAFSLICHLGTLLALLYSFRKKIVSIFSQDRFTLIQLSLALIPLFFIAYYIKPIREIYADSSYLGPFFFITAFTLYGGITLGKDLSPAILKKNRVRDPFIIGLFQAIAIFPGISRSGLTISISRILGWNWNDAITFSFLLAAPTIIGGAAFELISLQKNVDQQFTLNGVHFLLGFLFSFIFGCGSLQCLFALARNQKMMYFVWYCLIVGIGATLATIL